MKPHMHLELTPYMKLPPKNAPPLDFPAPIRPFFCGIVCFFTSNVSFRIFKKAGGFFFCKFPSAFFNILKEPLLVQKQRIPQKKVLILSFLDIESLRGMALSRGHHAKSIGQHGAKKVLLWQVGVVPS